MTTKHLLLVLLLGLGFFSCEELLQEAVPRDRTRPGATTVATNSTDWNNTGPGRLNNYEPSVFLGDELIKHKYYSASYSKRHKNAEWVAYELTAQRVEAPSVDRRGNFISDPANAHAAKNSDYSNTGYDRGHLAAAEDMSFSEEAMEQSFYMSNVTPQNPANNRGIWSRLEAKSRDWALKNGRLYVVTGTVLPQRIMPTTWQVNGIVVPRFIYKVILDYDLPERKGIAFIIPNEEVDRDLKSFAVPISEVEKRTNIKFFPSLSSAERRELIEKMDIGKWEF